MESARETRKVVPFAERTLSLCIRGEISPQTGIRGVGIDEMRTVFRSLDEVCDGPTTLAAVRRGLTESDS